MRDGHSAMIAAAISEMPFGSILERMSIERADQRVYIKGAIESVVPLSTTRIDGVAQAHTQMAERGLRVLAVAVAPKSDAAHATLVGLIGIADPPRPEAIAAIANDVAHARATPADKLRIVREWKLHGAANE